MNQYQIYLWNAVEKNTAQDPLGNTCGPTFSLYLGLVFIRFRLIFSLFKVLRACDPTVTGPSGQLIQLLFLLEIYHEK